jgi:hypothetical protein
MTLPLGPALSFTKCEVYSDSGFPASLQTLQNGLTTAVEAVDDCLEEVDVLY